VTEAELKAGRKRKESVSDRNAEVALQGCAQGCKRQAGPSLAAWIAIGLNFFGFIRVPLGFHLGPSGFVELQFLGKL